MSKGKEQLLFCRVCLKEISKREKSAYILQPPDPVLKLGDDVWATTYLQCYYYCLGRASIRASVDSLADYVHICLRCKEKLLKTTKFLVNSQTNEDFLMSILETKSADENGPLFGMNNEQTQDFNDEFEMNEEYLETTENESSTFAEEEYLLDTQLEDVKKADDDMKSLRYHCNDIGTFEEVILDAVKSNCELEQTMPAAADDLTKNKRRPLEELLLYFSCELCAKVFNYERQLYEHYNTEHDHKSFGFPCDICRQRHISFKSLRFHRHKVHKNFDYVDCEICGKAIVSKFYDSHREQHIFNCDKCDQTFKSKYAKLNHFRVDHEVVREKRYDCQECDRHFLSSENLKLHTMTHNNNVCSNSGGYNFTCYICSKTFPRPIKLKQHLEWHQGETMRCPHCNKDFTCLKDIEAHMRLHIKNFPYKCDICDRRFAIDEHLERHIQKHKVVRRYQCPICDYLFVSWFGLRQHSYHHTGWPLTCKLCDKGFASVFMMRRHLKSVHRNVFDNRYSDDMLDKLYERHKIKEISPKMENMSLYVHNNKSKGSSNEVTFPL